MLTQSVGPNLPEVFKPTMQGIIQSLVPVLHANIQHEEFTNQILVFFQVNLDVTGFNPE